MGEPIQHHFLRRKRRKKWCWILHDEYIVMQRRPGEVKHLSSQMKRKQYVIPLVVASERGTVQTYTVQDDGLIVVRLFDSIPQRTGRCSIGVAGYSASYL